jgi:hypothetical protein
MRRATAVLFFAVAAFADDPEDLRPTDHAIAPPPGDFAPEPLPDGVHADPPADGWWKRAGACPRGTKLVKKANVKLGAHVWTSYVCEGNGSPKPYTAWNERSEREAWWKDADNKWHGGLYRRSFAYEDKELYVHGARVGHYVHRALDGSQEGFANYRGGHAHGLAHEAYQGITAGGYYVEDRRQGPWLVWNTPGDLMRARLRYRDGALDGAQRWWTRDGKILARGSFKAGEGSWTAFGTDGTRADTRCKGRDLVEATAWDRAGTMTMHACGPAAPPGCAVLGPTGGGERQKLGVVDCADATIPPFALF